MPRSDRSGPPRVAIPGARLSQKNVQDVAEGVASMPFRTRPTWNGVIAVARNVTRRDFSRQALSAHQAIVDAYDAKVAEHQRFRRTATGPTAFVEDEDPRAERIRRLEGDKADLQAKVAKLDERILLHIANAIRVGLTQRDLERPTQKPWKGPTAAPSSTAKRKP